MPCERDLRAALRVRPADAARAFASRAGVLRHRPASAAPREPGDVTGPARRLALLVATMREAYEVTAGEPASTRWPSAGC